MFDKSTNCIALKLPLIEWASKTDLLTIDSMSLLIVELVR